MEFEKVTRNLIRYIITDIPVNNMIYSEEIDYSTVGVIFPMANNIHSNMYLPFICVYDCLKVNFLFF